jgi:hypothetical protein
MFLSMLSLSSNNHKVYRLVILHAIWKMLELNFIQGIQINQHDHHTPCMLYKSSSCDSGNHLALVEDLLKKITPCNHHSPFYTIST